MKSPHEHQTGLLWGIPRPMPCRLCSHALMPTSFHHIQRPMLYYCSLLLSTGHTLLGIRTIQNANHVVPLYLNTRIDLEVLEYPEIHPLKSSQSPFLMHLSRPHLYPRPYARRLQKLMYDDSSPIAYHSVISSNLSCFLSVSFVQRRIILYSSFLRPGISTSLSVVLI